MDSNALNIARFRARFPGALIARELVDGRLVVVYPQVLGGGLLTLSEPEPAGLRGWEEAWDYPEVLRAMEAAQGWNGDDDPLDGWVRYRNNRITIRRHDGDPNHETIHQEESDPTYVAAVQSGTRRVRRDWG